MRILILLSLWIAGLAGGCASPEPITTIESRTGLSGDPVTIRIENAPETVRIIAERNWGWPETTLHRSSAVFQSVNGVIDVSENAPVSGSYSGVSPAGLFWAMKNTDEADAQERASALVTFEVDYMNDGTIDFVTAVDLKSANDAFEEVNVTPDLPGAFLYLPDGVDRPPVIIAMGGSEGGDRSARRLGSKFASRGYAVLGLPYYSPAYGNQEQQFPELPRTFVDIPVDKIEIARDWLRQREDVDASRLALYGVSKGAELALVAASKIEGISAVIAIVPTDVIWEGWGSGAEAGTTSSFSWRGQPLPFMPYYKMEEEIAKFSDPNANARMRTPHDAGREAYPERLNEARIRVEAIDAPVFLVGGDKDDVWASGPMARTIKATRDAAGLSTELYVDPGAGHYLSGDGYAPMYAFLDEEDAAVEARLRVQAWQAMMVFLIENL
ncbi:MAG: acyl-CoA thioester hydrolase/BAAT C-terminal domain-containing protein [Pseudomonadota bacterium]